MGADDNTEEEGEDFQVVLDEGQLVIGRLLHEIDAGGEESTGAEGLEGW